MAMTNNVNVSAAQARSNAESDRAAAATYIAELGAELATLARRHGLNTLGYLLDMARLEAEEVRRHVNGRR
jgi:hypothetical protein